MAQTIYTRVLPNLTRATRAKVYEGLSTLLSHLDPMNLDLLSVSIDVPTRTITLVLTDPLTDDELDHFGML